MSYEVTGRISVKVLLNDEEFPFLRANSLEFLHLSSSTKLAAPMCHLALQDNIDFLSESKHLADGAKIQLVISARDSGQSNTYAFRLNSYARTSNSGAQRYEIDGFLDCNLFWNYSTFEAFKGTSFVAISDIAKRTELGVSGDQTADSQVWLPRNIPYYEWARLIAERGYRSENSCMQLGLDLDRTLEYKDVSEFKSPKALFSYGGYREGYLLAIDVSPSIKSGSMNHHSGYSESQVEQDVLNQNFYRTNSKILVNKQAREGTLLLNQKLKKSINQNRVTFAPIDVGNVHVEYEKALYQNRRNNNLFSSVLNLVTPEPSTLHLLDVVTVSMEKASEHLKIYSGDYRIATKTIHVKNNDYFEKYELLRRTLNAQLQDA